MIEGWPLVRGRLVPLVLLLVLFVSCGPPPPRFFYDFESEADLDTLPWKCGTVFSLAAEHATHGRRCLRMDLYPAASGSDNRYPGVGFRNFDPDWSGVDFFRFEVYNPEARPIQLTLRIDDREQPRYEERYNGKIVLEPGLNRVSLRLADLMTSGSRRHLDLGRINAVLLFLADPPRKHTLYLDHLRTQ